MIVAKVYASSIYETCTGEKRADKAPHGYLKMYHFALKKNGDKANSLTRGEKKIYEKIIYIRKSA